MNRTQENIVSMFETTLAYLDVNNSIWSPTAAFATAVTDAKNGVQAIRAAAANQEAPTSGITDDKAQARSDLEDQTLEIADQLAALAAKTNDGDLAAKTQLTRSMLDQMQDDDLMQAAQRVSNLATTNIAALAPYGITPADVTALNTATTAFSGMKTAPRQAAAGRKSATASVAQLISDTRSVFRNQLDKLMTPFRKPNTDFYTGYFAARLIVDRSATHAAPKKPAKPAPAPA